ncbi:DJ-1/PfpI family protein [Marinitenerispora sediminis]|uniref:Glutamine amidotransferase n=1 Tax=Marinitenerispora sediminis TaxID=1931232 RepID=A0A368T6F7_9ACTN|nr:DJ-1/PfpI family protein [Marinitenerispora sediminis]RCV51724.1 glutamine amidotransferase [Marinitenerispora sediminis]RCV55107.1 glutamine amidotransferase [Marinitenerispora sediminis]RCV59078.1 glutamine amidotransferase [Marinitenerispora sediminis]
MLAQFVLFDGFDPLDVIAPHEVFFAAGMATGGAVAAELVAAEGAREVPSGVPGVSLRAAGRLDPARADIVVLPGAAGALPSEEEVSDEERARTIPAILGRALETDLPALAKEALDRDDTLVATVCGGSMVLAMAGLIEGRPATTHHMGMDLLEATGAVPVAARVVDDGDLVTGSSVTSGLDLALYLVEREVGPQVAHAVETFFAHERRGTVWARRGTVPAL